MHQPDAAAQGPKLQQQQQQDLGVDAAGGAAGQVLPAHCNLPFVFAELDSGDVSQQIAEAYELTSKGLDNALALQAATEASARADDSDDDSSSSSSSNACSCCDCAERRQQAAATAAVLDTKATIYGSTMLDVADSKPNYETLAKAIAAATSSTECLELLLQAPQLRGLPILLQAIGTALCNQLPAPWLCNNLGCTNMAGVSELQLVGGSSCVCGGCKVAR